MGVLLISEDLDEILALADRVASCTRARRRRGRRRDGDGRGDRAADGRRARLRLIRIERRLRQPRWLTFVVPVVSLGRRVRPDGARAARDAPSTGAHVPAALRLGVRRAEPARLDAGRRDAADLHRPLRCGRVPHAAVQHRRRGAALRRARSSAPLPASRSATRAAPVSIAAMILAGAAGGAAFALIPGVLRAFFSTNEIITSLMLNYVARARPQLPDLRLASRTGATPRRPTPRSFRRAKTCPDSASWPVAAHRRARSSPLGFLVGGRRRRAALGALHAHALRLRGAGDRRLAARRDATPGSARAARSSP